MSAALGTTAVMVGRPAVTIAPALVNAEKRPRPAREDQTGARTATG